MTVNFKNGTMADYDGDGRTGDEDVDGDNVPDVIIQKSSISTVVNFFAWANDNRMPIRKVIVDWNDGGRTPITNENVKGLYRNRKPLCFGVDDAQKFCGMDNATRVGKGLSCKEDSDCASGDRCAALGESYGKRFGSYLPDACEASYFEYVHDYTCGRGDVPIGNGVPIGRKGEYVKQVSNREAIDEKTAEKLLRLGLKPESWVCVYKPKVQVMDNWEWCNGSCGDLAHPELNSGCYRHEIRNGRETDSCDTNNPEPWTEYKGSIIVIPPSPLLQAAAVR